MNERLQVDVDGGFGEAESSEHLRVSSFPQMPELAKGVDPEILQDTWEYVVQKLNGATDPRALMTSDCLPFAVPLLGPISADDAAEKIPQFYQQFVAMEDPVEIRKYLPDQFLHRNQSLIIKYFAIFRELLESKYDSSNQQYLERFFGPLTVNFPESIRERWTTFYDSKKVIALRYVFSSCDYFLDFQARITALDELVQDGCAYYQPGDTLCTDCFCGTRGLFDRCVMLCVGSIKAENKNAEGLEVACISMNEEIILNYVNRKLQDQNFDHRSLVKFGLSVEEIGDLTASYQKGVEVGKVAEMSTFMNVCSVDKELKVPLTNYQVFEETFPGIPKTKYICVTNFSDLEQLQGKIDEIIGPKEELLGKEIRKREKQVFEQRWGAAEHAKAVYQLQLDVALSEENDSYAGPRLVSFYAQNLDFRNFFINKFCKERDNYLRVLHRARNCHDLAEKLAWFKLIADNLCQEKCTEEMIRLTFSTLFVFPDDYNDPNRVEDFKILQELCKRKVLRQLEKIAKEGKRSIIFQELVKKSPLCRVLNKGYEKVSAGCTSKIEEYFEVLFLSILVKYSTINQQVIATALEKQIVLIDVATVELQQYLIFQNCEYASTIPTLLMNLVDEDHSITKRKVKKLKNEFSLPVRLVDGDLPDRAKIRTNNQLLQNELAVDLQRFGQSEISMLCDVAKLDLVGLPDCYFELAYGLKDHVVRFDLFWIEKVDGKIVKHLFFVYYEEGEDDRSAEWMEGHRKKIRRYQESFRGTDVLKKIEILKDCLLNNLLFRTYLRLVQEEPSIASDLPGYLEVENFANDPRNRHVLEVCFSQLHKVSTEQPAVTGSEEPLTVEPVSQQELVKLAREGVAHTMQEAAKNDEARENNSEADSDSTPPSSGRKLRVSRKSADAKTNNGKKPAGKTEVSVCGLDEIGSSNQIKNPVQRTIREIKRQISNLQFDEEALREGELQNQLKTAEADLKHQEALRTLFELILPYSKRKWITKKGKEGPDLLCTNGSKAIMWEVKSLNDCENGDSNCEKQLEKAFFQLYKYDAKLVRTNESFNYFGSNLKRVILLSKKPGENLQTVIEAMEQNGGVFVMWLENGFIQGSKRAMKMVDEFCTK
jgi:hypothetical protein